MTRHRNTTRAAAGGFVALGCVGFIATAPALAQESAQPTRLEGVTVTDTAAQEAYGAVELSSPKATARILNTPRIVNVITEDVLQDTGTFSLEEAFRTVPGITLGAGEGGVASADIPLIRGVDATGDVFVDGVRDIGSQQREIFALERIEVAKGPSSAFGGRGTAAGAINLVSKVARRGDFASAQITGGTSDLVRITGDVNRELGEHAAVRVVGLYHDSMVPGRDEVFDDRWGVASSVTLGAGSPFSATLDYYHLEGDAMPDYGIPLTSRGQLPGGRREAAETDRDNFYGLLNRDFRDTNVDAMTGQIEWALGSGFVLSNTTRYSDTRHHYIVTNPDDSAGNVANGLVWRNIKSRGSRQEGIGSNTNLAGVFNTGSLLHSLSLGVEYSHAESTNAGYLATTGNYRFDPAVPGSGCNAQALAAFDCTPLANPDPSDPWAGTVARNPSVAVAEAEDVSLYLFDTVTIVPALLLNGGVRWTDYSASGAGILRGTPYDVANEGSFWSYQGGAVFKPSEATSLYVSYANAKTPPGTTVGEGGQDLNASNSLYEPQTTENWEAGAKAEMLGGGLLVSAAIFQIDRQNIQNTVDDVVTDVFDAARLRGFEVSATGTVGPVRMLVGYTFLDSELRSDAASGDADPGNDATSNVGKTLPQTPRHNVAATVDWQVVPRFSVGAGAYGASKRYADAANLIRAGGYVRFDAHAQFEVNDRLGVRVNVNNLTDERYIAKIRNPHFAVPAAGRQALVTLTARY